MASGPRVLDFIGGSDLPALCNFFLSSVGPSGSVKTFVSAVGGLTVAATSNRLIRSTVKADLLLEFHCVEYLRD